MLFSLLVIFISALLIFIQSFNQTKLSWKAVLLTIPVLIVVSIFDIYSKNKESEFQIEALKKLLEGNIYWHKSRMLSSLTGYAPIEPTDVNIEVKIYPTTYNKLNSSVNIDKYFKYCRDESDNTYSFLSPADAESLYFEFKDKNGDLYIDIERDAGVEHLFFEGKLTEENNSIGSTINMALIKSPVSDSKISTLKQLNSSIIVFKIGNHSSGVPSYINWRLYTDIGEQSLHIPFRLKRVGYTKEISNFTALCIPQAHFGA